MIYSILVAILSVAALWCAAQISIADFRRRIIPDVYLWPLLLIGIIFAAWMPVFGITPRMAATGAAFGYALSAGVGFVFDWRLRKTNPDAIAPIGMGDIKLIATGGIWLGTTGLAVALVIACATGAIWSKRKNQKYIPFAPFFLFGGFLSLIGMLFLI